MEEKASVHQIIGIGATQIFTEDTITLEFKSIDKKIAVFESQIDALKSKGLKNLSKEERIEFWSLKKELLTTEREKTAQYF